MPRRSSKTWIRRSWRIVQNPTTADPAGLCFFLSEPKAQISSALRNWFASQRVLGGCVELRASLGVGTGERSSHAGEKEIAVIPSPQADISAPPQPDWPRNSPSTSPSIVRTLNLCCGPSCITRCAQWNSWAIRRLNTRTGAPRKRSPYTPATEQVVPGRLSPALLHDAGTNGTFAAWSSPRACAPLHRIGTLTPAQPTLSCDPAPRTRLCS